jgi:hypothetical protein
MSLSPNGVYTDDLGEFISDTSLYSTNCNKFNKINFITVPDGSALFLENVDVKYFQQQYNSFIYARGSVNMTFVNFYRVQAYSHGA